MILYTLTEETYFSLVSYTFFFRGAFRYIRLLLLVYYYQKLNLTVPQAFAKTVKSHENKTAIIFEDQAWTFKDLEEYSNRVANYFLRAGYKPGQCIALFMENRPEYVGLWLGCSKIGLVPALINSNLAGQSLLHSINAACARAIICGGEFLEGKKKFFFNRLFISRIKETMLCIKGQLISKCPFEKSVLSKIPTKKFPRFLS